MSWPTPDWAHLFQIAGPFDEAEEHLRAALTEKPDLPQAYQLLSLIERLNTDDVGEIERLLDRQDLGPENREALHSALGRFLDKTKDFDGAFHHFRSANELRKPSLSYDPDQHDRTVDEIIEAHPASMF